MFWTAAVFAVLVVPPLVAAWRAPRREEKREEKESEQRRLRSSH